MTLTHLWRYPVKTMAGESLTHATLGALGIMGDRVLHVENSQGRVITSRTHPGFLGHQGTFDSEGNLLVDGQPWQSAAVTAKVEALAGSGARLVHDESEERFDVLPLLIATDGAITAFGHDYRRLRPNLVIGGVDGLAERGWPGGYLRIGDVLIGIQDLRQRCIMTSFDPDTQAQDKTVTQGIYARFDGKLALNCYVIQGGQLTVGDTVEFHRQITPP